MANFSNLRRKRKGANAIEFALTLPVFLLIVSGIFDFSWFAFQRSIVKSASMNGCRAASLIDPGEDDITLNAVYLTGEAAMLSEVSLLGGDGLCSSGCTTSVSVLGTAPGRSLKCTISGEYKALWGMAVGDLTIESSSITLMEWQRYTL